MNKIYNLESQLFHGESFEGTTAAGKRVGVHVYVGKGGTNINKMVARVVEVSRDGGVAREIYVGDVSVAASTFLRLTGAA